MRKLILLLFLTVALTSVKAIAAYRYIEFKTNDNTTTVVEADGLAVTVADGVLSLSNTSGQKMDIDASTLVSMRFTDVSGAIDNITVDSDSKVQVYKLEGTVVGAFTDVSDAINTLAPGVYILKSTEGQTVKIMIGK